MKHCIVVFCLIIFVGGLGTPLLHAQDTLILSGEAKQPVGIITTRILTEAYRRIGIKIETREYPGARSLHMANDGAVDGELFRGNRIEKDFLNLIRIPVVLAYDPPVVFTRDVEFEVTGWDSLRPYTIGTLLGMKGAIDSTAGMNVEPVATAEQLFKKLAAGRNEIVVLSRYVGVMTLTELRRHEVEDMTFDDITILEPPLATGDLYHFLHKKHEQLIPKITTVLQQMEEEGLIQRIRDETEAELFDVTP